MATNFYEDFQFDPAFDDPYYDDRVERRGKRAACGCDPGSVCATHDECPMCRNGHGVQKSEATGVCFECVVEAAEGGT